MIADSLKISQNEDKSFTFEWDKKDPRWSFLNGLTEKEIRVILEQAIKDYLSEIGQSPTGEKMPAHFKYYYDYDRNDPTRTNPFEIPDYTEL